VSGLAIAGLASMLFVAAFTVQQARRAATHGQSPRESIIEAWTNIVIGFSINYVANLIILPLAVKGGTLTLVDNFWMGWLFTVISILRQFAIRRWFNNKAAR
jgi:hypothetical protein